MKNFSFLIASVAFVSAHSLTAQDGKMAENAPTAPSPNEIVDAGQPADWVAIPPSDLLIMDLAPDSDGSARRVIIQLMPVPFGSGHVGNIRKLAAAHWWDGTAIVRVQDNYVTQWGDPTEKKPLPAGLAVIPEDDYVVKNVTPDPRETTIGADNYAANTAFENGWPIASGGGAYWPVHCYAMVGVGRNFSPDTGTGAELYTVIGHAPRHLDRNIALVGRIISGMEHMSSLPRGTGPLGFYEKEEERVPILSVRLGDELPEQDRPRFEYLDTASDRFSQYAGARINRLDPFFIKPAGGADICNIPVPVRPVEKAAVE